MGLIRIAADVIGAGFGSLNGALESGIWKEYITSGDMSGSILMKRGEKVLGAKGKNTRADDNLISSGSGIDVQEGQCMIIVDNGQVVEFCTEPGRYTYDRSTQPSLLSGQNKGLKAFGKEILNQWSAGGQRFSTQRVYFINMGQIYEPILWGLGNCQFIHSFQPNPNINPIKLNVKLKAHGTIRIRIENPVNFYKEIGAQKAGGDNDGVISVRSVEDSLFKTVKSALSSAVSSSITQLGRENVVSYGEIMAFSDTVSEFVTNKMANHSLVQAGFGFYDFYIEGSPELSDADYKRIMDMEEKYNMVSDPLLANYDIQKTMASGFHEAGKNGGVTGIMGMGMAMGGGMGNLGNLQGMPNNGQPVYPAQPVAPRANPTPMAGAAVGGAADADGWACSCGTINNGKFCMNCGNKKPEPQPMSGGTWVCDCGASNTGRFCPNCGRQKPVKRTMRCDKCGWVAPDGAAPMKFCPECGDPITAADYN